MKQLRITVTRDVQETKTVTIDVDDEVATKILAEPDPSGTIELWAAQQVSFAEGGWKRVQTFGPKQTVKVEAV